MKVKMFRRVLLGVSLLTSLSAGAQQFASELLLSTDEATYWYRICNALPGMQDYVMTDNNAEMTWYAPEPLVELLRTEKSAEKSQWKLTAGADGKVILTNRATGMQLANASNNIGNHNATQLISEGSDGFTFTALGDNAFMLQSVEDDGVNRCLAMAEQDTDPLTYPDANESTSVIGWKFMLVESVLTGIGSAEAGRPVIRVANKRVHVNGCPEWQLFNSQGEEMPRTTTLAVGVYLVKTPKEVFKVMVY